MNSRMKPATAPILRDGEATAVNQPDPLAAGNEASQVEAALPGKPGEDEDPDSTEDVPPGEHKREPIDDPDPADAPLQVRCA